MSSTGAFMRLGVGARAGSMGDAYVAAASGPEAIYWNPARMATEPSWQFALTQRRYALDRNFSFAGLSVPLGERFAAGLAWTGFRTGGLEARTGNTQAPDALFADDENAFSAAMGYRVSSWLYTGLTAKFISQRLFDRTAKGYTAGPSFFLQPATNLSFGLALQDLFSSYKWDASLAERLPSTLMLGAAWQFTPQALLTLDYHYAGPANLFQQDWWRRQGRLRAGTEWRALRALPLRLGYSTNSFSAGAGFEIPVSTSLLALDYHYGVQDGLNNNGHAFSVRLDFGSRRGVRDDDDSDFATRRNGDNRSVSIGRRERSARQLEDTQRLDSARQRARNTLASSANQTAAGGTWLTISSAKLNVRIGPGTRYKKIGFVYRGSRYEVLRQQESWFEIRWNGNQTGWVKANFVTRKKMAGK